MINGGQLSVALDNPRLLGGLAAVVIAALTGRMVLTIIAGMGIMWVVQALALR